MNFGQLNLGNLNIQYPQQKPIIPADTVIVPDAGNQYPDNTVDTQQNWFEEIIDDPITVVVLIIILASTFVICFAVFLKLLEKQNEKNKNKKKK